MRILFRSVAILSLHWMQCYPYVNAVVQHVNRCVTDVVTTIALGYKNVEARIIKKFRTLWFSLHCCCIRQATLKMKVFEDFGEDPPCYARGSSNRKHSTILIYYNVTRSSILN